MAQVLGMHGLASNVGCVLKALDDLVRGFVPYRHTIPSNAATIPAPSSYRTTVVVAS